MCALKDLKINVDYSSDKHLTIEHAFRINGHDVTDSCWS